MPLHGPDVNGVNDVTTCAIKPGQSTPFAKRQGSSRQRAFDFAYTSSVPPAFPATLLCTFVTLYNSTLTRRANRLKSRPHPNSQTPNDKRLPFPHPTHTSTQQQTYASTHINTPTPARPQQHTVTPVPKRTRNTHTNTNVPTPATESSPELPADSSTYNDRVAEPPTWSSELHVDSSIRPVELLPA